LPKAACSRPATMGDGYRRKRSRGSASRSRDRHRRSEIATLEDAAVEPKLRVVSIAIFPTMRHGCWPSSGPVAIASPWRRKIEGGGPSASRATSRLMSTSGVLCRLSSGTRADSTFLLTARQYCKASKEAT
jgi:hypothetical protein